MIRKTYHHLLRLLAIGCLTTAIVLIAMRFLTAPINRELSGLRSWLTEVLHTPTEIRVIKLRWQGRYVVVDFTDVQVFDPDKIHDPLLIQHVELRIRPLASLFARKFIFAELAFSGINASLIRHADGAFTLAGMSLNNTISEHSSPVQWMPVLAALPIEAITIHQANIQVMNEEGQSWPLENINVVLKKQGDILIVRSQGRLFSGEQSTPFILDTNIDLKKSLETLQVFISVNHLQAERLKVWFGRSALPVILNGTVNVKIWADLAKGLVSKSTAFVEVNNLLLPAHQSETLFIEHATGEFRFLQKTPTDWTLEGSHFNIGHLQNSALFTLNRQWDANHQPQYLWKGRDIHLEHWTPFIGNLPAIPLEIRQKLQQIQPKGDIRYAQITHTNDSPLYSAVLDVRNLAAQPYQQAPGFNGVDFLASFDNTTGYLSFLAPNPVTLSYLSVSGPDTAVFTQFRGYTKWWLEDTVWRVENEWQFEWEKSPMTLIARLSQEDNTLPVLHAVLTIPSIPATLVSQKFPAYIMDDPDGAAWLKKSILSGFAENAVIVFHGPLADNPYKNNRGRFEAGFQVSDVKLDYNPDWPVLEHLSGSILFHNNRFETTFPAGWMIEHPVRHLWATIDDLNKPLLKVGAAMDATFKEAQEVLEKSNLKADFKPLYDSVQLKGPLSLDLGLTIPLNDKDPLQVQGVIQTHNSHASVPDLNVTLADLQGNIHFTENTLQSDLQGTFLETPVALVVKGAFSGVDPEVTVGAKMHLTLSKIFEWQNVSSLTHLTEESDFDVVITIPEKAEKPIVCTIKAPLYHTDLAFKAASWKDNKTDIDIQSDVLSGSLQWQPAQGKEHGKLSGHVQHFTWHPEWKFGDQSLKAIPELPVIQLKVDAFHWNTHHFYQWGVDAVPHKGKGYDIINLESHGDDLVLDSAGTWYFQLSQSPASLKGTWKSKNIGRAIQSMGFETNIRDAKSMGQFNLHWTNQAGSIQLPSLTGAVQLEMSQGRILGINPGLGRIFSLFSPDNWKRRLQLDFSDLYKAGFSFDTLAGPLQFGGGMVKSDRIKIKGPSAQIEASGQVDLVTHQMDAKLLVTPKVGGTLSTAAAIAAGNPAVGAAVWLIDKVVTHNQPIAQLEYRVTGDWDEPVVTEPKTVQ